MALRSAGLFLCGVVFRNSAKLFSTSPALCVSKLHVREALNAAIEEEMKRDDRVSLIGEE
ncbi:unnamed protein product, partial [Soboliphyme baturini]|uniref:Acyl-CoA dehydrogenase family member 9, mitochondrial n=1 Tax=Soboliphyme baturini TaxID=241478 RepID=A0A183IAD4_9BILA